MNFATISEETSGGSSRPIAWDRLERLREKSSTGALMAAYSSPATAQLEIGDIERPLRVAAVSAGFFSAFTKPLSAGHSFSFQDEQVAGRRSIILSLPLAITLFRSPYLALGHAVKLDGLYYTVIGVAPSHFTGIFGTDVDAWAPANCVVPLLFKLHNQSIGAEGELWKSVPGFYALTASGYFTTSELFELTVKMLPPSSAGEPRLHVSEGLTTDPVRDLKLRKWSRLCLLLAIAFTVATSLNYCGLLVAKAPLLVAQVRLKQVLGASSGRLISELLTGPAVLVGASFVGSGLVLFFGLKGLASTSVFYKQLIGGSLHAAVACLESQIYLAGLLTLIISLLPALRLLKDSGAPRLGYTSTGTKRMSWVFGAIVTGQIAFCIVSCTLAFMITSAVLRLMTEPLGYEPNHLSVVQIMPSSGSINLNIQDDGMFPLAVTFASLMEQVAALPNVKSVSVATSAPFDKSTRALSLEKMDGSSATVYSVNYNGVTENYFKTLGTKILSGKGFSAALFTGRATEVVVNQMLASELWPDGNALHRTVRLTSPATGIEFTCTIVGIVEDMRFSGLNETPEPMVFLPLRGSVFILGMPYSIVANGSTSFRALQARVNDQLSSEMPTLKAQQGFSIGERVEDVLGGEKERGYFAVGGAIAIALVAYAGLYASLIFYVNTKRRELAVRVCFGASPWRIRAIVMRQATTYAFVGGLVSAFAWPMLAASSTNEWLGKASWSVWSAIFIALFCIATSMVMSLLPAKLATRISPVEALKEL